MYRGVPSFAALVASFVTKKYRAFWRQNSFKLKSILSLHWNCFSPTCQQLWIKTGKCFCLCSLENHVALRWQKVGQRVGLVGKSSEQFPFFCLFYYSLYHLTLRNSPCSRMAWAPCGKDVAVGVSSSSRLVCGSDRPLQDFAGPFFSPWLPLPPLCHAPWRPWDLGNMREQLGPSNWPLS